MGVATRVKIGTQVAIGAASGKLLNYGSSFAKFSLVSGELVIGTAVTWDGRQYMVTSVTKGLNAADVVTLSMVETK